MKTQFNLQNEYFNAIKDGLKTAEGRIAKSKYVSLKNGDDIVFTPNNGTGSLTARVVAVKKYDSFRSMLESEGVGTMLPGVSSVDEGVKIYSSFGNYADDVEKHGCVAIVFELQG